MTSKYESAKLILELYDLRREETMRKARDWFARFDPQTAQDFYAIATGEHGAYYRMVTSYWDMAASLVNHGAIDEQMFTDANGEHVAVFAKIHPFLDELRQVSGSPTYMQHLEQLVMGMPDAEARMARVREMLRRFAQPSAKAAS